MHSAHTVNASHVVHSVHTCTCTVHSEYIHAHTHTVPNLPFPWWPPLGSAILRAPSATSATFCLHTWCWRGGGGGGGSGGLQGCRTWTQPCSGIHTPSGPGLLLVLFQGALNQPGKRSLRQLNVIVPLSSGHRHLWRAGPSATHTHPPPCLRSWDGAGRSESRSGQSQQSIRDGLDKLTVSWPRVTRPAVCPTSLPDPLLSV